MATPDRNLQNPKQNAINVEIHPATDSSGVLTHPATESSVNDSATSVTLLAASQTRSGATIRNTSTARLYISLTSTATTASPIYLNTGDIYELPVLANGEVYRGIITGIWTSAVGGTAVISQTA